MADYKLFIQELIQSKGKYIFYLYSYDGISSQQVSTDNIDRFWHTYCTLFNKNVTMTLAEILPEYIPIMLELAKPVDVSNVITILHSRVKELLVEPCYYTIVMESAKRVHIRMPYCVVSPNLLIRYIYPAIPNVIVDILHNPIPLYGSSDLVITGVYDQAMNRYNPEDIFNPLYHLHSVNIHQSIFNLYNVKFWLPLLLSLNYYTQPSALTAIPEISELVRLISSASEDSIILDDSHVKMFLSMISAETINRSFMDIGKSLYNIYSGSDDGLKLWISLSPDKHSLCNEYYRYRFNKNNPLTIKTLAWYAMKDSPNKYSKWHTEWCMEALNRAKETYYDTDIAYVIYRYYWLIFVTTGESKSKWWYFNGTRWINDSAKIKLMIYHNFIPFVSKYPDMVKILSSNKLERIISNLATFFHDTKFNEFRDYNTGLIGMVDNVLEVNKNGIIVRDAKPEDYITKSTYIRWDNSMSWEHPIVKRCMTWFNQLFPDPDETELRDYFLRVMASVLKSGNKEKYMFILYGQKDGAKSTIKRLLELTLGDYAHTFPTSTFMGKSANGSSPSPEMALSKGTLIAFIQEPDENDHIRNGLVKMLTGNDTFFTRMLFDNGGKILPTFKLFLMCNTIPNIPSSDEALKERLVIIPFRSKWIFNPPDSPTQQLKTRTFKIDPDFEDDKLPLLSAGMIWIMVNYYQRYLAQGTAKRPEVINKIIKEYWENIDIYSNFIKDCVVEVKDVRSKVPVNTLYNEFKSWFSQCFPGIKIPTMIKFKEEISKKYGVPKVGGWEGISINKMDILMK